MRCNLRNQGRPFNFYHDNHFRSIFGIGQRGPCVNDWRNPRESGYARKYYVSARRKAWDPRCRPPYRPRNQHDGENALSRRLSTLSAAWAESCLCSRRFRHLVGHSARSKHVRRRQAPTPPDRRAERELNPEQLRSISPHREKKPRHTRGRRAGHRSHYIAKKHYHVSRRRG